MPNHHVAKVNMPVGFASWEVFLANHMVVEQNSRPQAWLAPELNFFWFLEWILKIKYKWDDFIDMYKAWFIAKGFTQIEGIVNEKTFSLFVRFSSLCTILAMVTKLDHELVQMNVKIAFLHEVLDEEIFMDQS